MKESIRVIDGGGNGFRKADIDVANPLKVNNFDCMHGKLISTPEQLLDYAFQHFSKHTIGVSYAMAGEIKDGVVVESPQIHMLRGVNLAELTTRRTGRPTLVVNDMDGAIIGMRALLPDQDYFMAITWGSGIGVRIFRNGEILAQGEGGHIPLDPSPFAPLCGCGLRGCAESIIGGESIKQRVIAEANAIGIRIPEEVHPCHFLDNSYDKGLYWAEKIYQLIARAMGSFLATYQSILHLPLVVWKGGFALRFLDRKREKTESLIRGYMREKLINSEWEKEMKFVISPDPERDSLIGAAALFQQTYK